MRKAILIPIIILMVVFISGCVSEQDIQNQKRQQQILAEFNQHVDTDNDDTLEMNGIMGKYNLKSISLDERIDVVNEYIRFYNVRITHLNDFYNFIIYNEQVLKDSGVDTYYWKKSTKDTISILNNNIEGMKNDVESLIKMEEELRKLKNQQQMTQQQYSEYYDLLKLLGGMLI